MGQVIDCRIVNNKVVFRVWTSHTDSYLTTPMSEKELIRYMRQSEMDAAMKLERLPYLIEVAKKRGSSGITSSLAHDPWREEQNPEEAMVDLSGMYFCAIDNTGDRGQHESPLLGEEKEILEFLRDRLIEEQVQAFVTWADLACYGDVWQGVTNITVIRVLHYLVRHV